MSDFDYSTAFSRNIGWVTEAEQQRLRRARVAIAGLGGVGGAHALTLARLGVGAFNLADFDRFDLENFNRQAGASMATVGRPKLDVLADMLRAINPEVEVRRFPAGVNAQTVDDFCRDVDVYVDGLDFFAFASRELVFARCHALGVPAVTAAPLGMGVALLNFLPGKMSFEDYFGFAGRSDFDKAIRFIVGLAPRFLHRGALQQRVDLSTGRGPSTVMACELCAGAAATQVLKIVLHRGKVPAAPWALQFDAYANRCVTTWRPGGHRNPLQALLRRLAAGQYRSYK